MDVVEYEAHQSPAAIPSSSTSPPHACRYCAVYQPQCVARCNGCGKWFCNGRASTSGSHIVTHLVRSKHKEVQLHSESALGESVLECYFCGTRNVFLLGFMAGPQDGVVLLLCREPCLSQAALRSGASNTINVHSLEFKVSGWQPLIDDRAFLPWVLPPPDAATVSAQSRPAGPQLINKLEELWKTHPDADFSDLERPGVDDALESVPLRYTDAFHYQNVFAPLVRVEADFDRRVKESQRQEAVSVRWDIGLNRKRLAYFVFTKEDNESRLVIGDELRLRYRYDNGEEWTAAGHVARLTQTEEVCLELRCSAGAPGPWTNGLTVGFTVEFVWKSTSFDRMQRALRQFAFDDSSVAANLYRRLLGHETEEASLGTSPADPPKLVQVPHLAKLNHSQIQAVTRALTSPLCLIQGPPGTGKTVTSAAIVYHLCTLNHAQVLVAAPSNVAVDQLAEKVHGTGLKVVRLCARSREAVASSVEFLGLHHQVEQMAKAHPRWSELGKLFKLKREVGELSQGDERRLRTLVASVEQEVLRAADVVCTTCVGCGDNRLSQFRFRYVLVDEATQATEPECILPLVMGARQLILVGDHCQLGPVIMCKKAAKAGLRQSLFERLVFLGNRPVRLEVQYRMHPALAELPSQTFYEGSLQNGVTLAERSLPELDFPWPNPDVPMLFYNSSGFEEMSASGTSYLNRSEAQNVERVVNLLFKCGLQASQIGVITPYDGQRAHLSSVFQRQEGPFDRRYAEVEVASIDAFQGREKDVIILSCVRSNQHVGIGFLRDPRRLNVALTRARYGIVICGNAKVLARRDGDAAGRSKVWCHLLSHLKSLGCVVEGPLNALRPCTLSLPSSSTGHYLTTAKSHQVPHQARRHLNLYQGDILEGDDSADELEADTGNQGPPSVAAVAAAAAVALGNKNSGNNNTKPSTNKTPLYPFAQLPLGISPPAESDVPIPSFKK